MSNRSETTIGPQPEWDDNILPAEPEFIASKPAAESFEQTAENWELHKDVRRAVQEISESSVGAGRKPEDTIKAKHFKVGEVDLDEYPTDLSGFSIGRVLTAEEMVSIDERLKTQWKNLPQQEQERNIREYLRLKDDIKKN